MLKTLDECADRIEAGRAYFGNDNSLWALARRLRNSEIELTGLSNLRREAQRLIEACDAVDQIVAQHQGRE
jgi:hypothetical protein